VFFQGADGTTERVLVSSDRELPILWSARRLKVGALPLWMGLDDDRRDRSLAPEIGRAERLHDSQHRAKVHGIADTRRGRPRVLPDRSPAL